MILTLVLDMIFFAEMAIVTDLAKKEGLDLRIEMNPLYVSKYQEMRIV